LNEQLETIWIMNHHLKRKPIFYQRDDLSPFNLLSQPVWVFDIENKSMWWANDSALDLWNADSLESLQQRDFAEDMSDATASTLVDYLATFKKGGKVTARVSEVSARVRQARAPWLYGLLTVMLFLQVDILSSWQRSRDGRYSSVRDVRS
jgi:hypothetical protein